jgi:hypothetical protein
LKEDYENFQNAKQMQDRVASSVPTTNISNTDSNPNGNFPSYSGITNPFRAPMTRPTTTTAPLDPSSPSRKPLKTIAPTLVNTEVTGKPLTSSSVLSSAFQPEILPLPSNNVRNNITLSHNNNNNNNNSNNNKFSNTSNPNKPTRKKNKNNMMQKFQYSTPSPTASTPIATSPVPMNNKLPTNTNTNQSSTLSREVEPSLARRMTGGVNAMPGRSNSPQQFANESRKPTAWAKANTANASSNVNTNSSTLDAPEPMTAKSLQPTTISSSTSSSLTTTTASSTTLASSQSVPHQPYSLEFVEGREKLDSLCAIHALLLNCYYSNNLLFELNFIFQLLNTYTCDSYSW